MGLGLIRYHSSYGSFNQLRTWAFEIVKPENITQDWHEYIREYATREQDAPKVPAMPFFWHSDCDGVMTVEEMKECLPVLLDIYDKKTKEINDCIDEDNFSKIIEKLNLHGLLLIVLDMAECIAQNKELEFR